MSSKMTKKDYELIAGVISGWKPDWNRKPHQIAEALAEALAQDNPKFNKAKFLAACGLKGDN